MRRPLLATALLLATFAAPPAPAATVAAIPGPPSPGLGSSVAPAGEDAWVAVYLSDGRVRLGRFSEAGRLERELVVEAPGMVLDAWRFAVDARGRFWLRARPKEREGEHEQADERTWAAAFSHRGRLVSQFEITGWGPYQLSPDGDLFVTRGADEHGREGLKLAHVDLDGIEPLFSLPREEYFGPPPGCSNQWLVTAPLAGRRFAVLRTWDGDGWLSVYDANGSRVARWPFRAEGDVHSVRLIGGPGSGVTVVHPTYFGAGESELRLLAFDDQGERLFQAGVPGDPNRHVALAPSGGFWMMENPATLRRLSSTGKTTSTLPLHPPPDGRSWPEHAARRRELARLPEDAPTHLWLEALLDGDDATTGRAEEWFLNRGAGSLPVLLDALPEEWTLWPLTARVLTTDPAAPAGAVAHLAAATPEARRTFAEYLGHMSTSEIPVLETYRDLLESLYVSGEEGRRDAERALRSLPTSPRLLAHQLELALDRGGSLYRLEGSIYERFGEVATALDEALATPGARRDRALEVLHWLLEQIDRRPPDEAPQLEHEMREWGRRWATRPEPDVARAGGLLVLATGDASNLPDLLAAALAEKREDPAEEAILRLLRFYPEALDKLATSSLLAYLHCSDCRRDDQLVATIRAVLSGEDFARAVEEYRLLPPDQPLPEHVFTALTAEHPRWTESDFVAFLDDQRLRTIPPSFRLAAFLDRVHRFAAHRPRTQEPVRELFLAVFNPEAVRTTLAELDPSHELLAIHRKPLHGHWLGALEPPELHGLLAHVPDEVLAAVEPPPDILIARKMRIAWGLARYVEKAGLNAPEPLREWEEDWMVPIWADGAPPEPPDLEGLLLRLDRGKAPHRSPSIAHLEAERGDVEAALLSRLDHRSAVTRAYARVLLAEMGSPRGRDVVLRETAEAIERDELPPAHLLAAFALHGHNVPAKALKLAATAGLSHASWSTEGLTPLATDRLARHLRDRAWGERGFTAIGAIRLLGALDDELAVDFVTELAAHHRDPEVAAAAGETAAGRTWR